MLSTSLLHLAFLVSLSPSSSSSIIQKVISRRQSEQSPCDAINGFECKCSQYRVTCTTTHDFSLPISVIQNEVGKYKSVELVVGAPQNVYVDDRSFEPIRELYTADSDLYEFRIKFEKFTGLHLSSPSIFNRVFPDNIHANARKQMALDIYNPEVAPTQNPYLFKNLNVDILELYALYPFYGSFQELFDGSNIKYLRLSGGDIRSDFSKPFKGNIARLELAKQATSLSAKNFPVYPTHEYIINAYYISEFDNENPPNYSNLGELRVHSTESIPANAFQNFHNIHTLSVTSDKSIDQNALNGLNKLEKLTIKEGKPSLAILNSLPSVKEYETNVESLDLDSQCQLVSKLANGQVAVQALSTSRECTCIIAYLNTAVGQAPCEVQECNRSPCVTIRNNYDISTHTFKAPPSIQRSDGTNAFHSRPQRIYSESFQVPVQDREKLHQVMPEHNDHNQEPINDHQSPSLYDLQGEPDRNDNIDDDEQLKGNEDRDSHREKDQSDHQHDHGTGEAQNQDRGHSPSSSNGQKNSSNGTEAPATPSKKGVNWLPMIIIAAFLIILIIVIALILIFRKHRAKKGYGAAPTNEQSDAKTKA